MASTAITIKDWRKEIPGHLTEDRRTFLFNKIVSVNSHGKKTEWRIIVRLFEGAHPANAVPTHAFIEIEDAFFDNKPMPAEIRAWITVLSRIEGGKVRDVVPTIVSKGKNLGRANATNVFCQALRDALGLHNKQLKKVVGEAPAEGGAAVRYPPMLAQLLNEQKRSIDFTKPVFVQRKYNGVRTVTTLDKAEGDIEFVIMYGRRKLLYPGFHYIKNELHPVLRYYWEEGRQLYLDGEIYKHGLPLQDISGYARREDKPEDIKLDYMIYDCFVANEPHLTFSQRKAILDEIFENFDHFTYSKKAETFVVHKMDEAKDLYSKFLDEEFEGAMIRIDEPYRYSYNEYHSKILLKMKPTFDAEFTCIGWTTGEKGKAAEALMIICQTDEGKEFNCTPAMEIPDRIALAKKMGEIEANGKTYFENNYKNTKIRVYFDEWSTSKIPQRARTKLERMGVDIIQ